MIDGMIFDSKKEANRYFELKILQKIGEIRDLQRQVNYLLIPEQREQATKGPRGGIRKGKLIERPCYYVADFVYTDVKGNVVVEDAKGMRTAEYKLKRKLMLHVHGIRIHEI